MNQPLEVTDFSAGITDNFLAGPQNAGQLFDNLLINDNKKPFTREGSTLRDTTAYQIPGGNKRISYMWDHRDQILEQSERNIFYVATPGTYSTLLGPTSNPVFSAGSESTHMSKAYWNNHSLLVGDNFCNPVKIFRNTNSTGTIKVLQAGLPDLANSPTCASSGGSGSNYIYAFLYYNTYDVEGVTFEDFGPTTIVSKTNIGAPNVNQVNISVIPVLANGITGNYDTAIIKVKIYRTQANGSVLNFLGEVTNGTTVFTDNIADATIVNNVPIYTTGDVVDNDPPPPAKFVHIANDIAMYGYVQESSISIPNRIRQSIKGDIDSCPVDFVDDYPDEIMGISSIQSTFIVFGKSSIFRLDGFFDEQGRGGMTHLKISDTFGAISNDAIVQVDDGIIFAAVEGWCYCDGYSVKRISHHLNDSYKKLVVTDTQSRNMWGAYDRIEKRVWFACQYNQASTDNDSCFILDLKWGISESSTYTTASNGQVFDSEALTDISWAPTCLLFKDANMYRAHYKGFVFKHDVETLTDPMVDLSILGANWAKRTIMHDYKSCSFNFGTSFVRKFVPKLLVTMANESNIAVDIFSNNDDGRKIQQLKAIRSYNNIIWGDPEIIWGDTTIVWNGSLGLIEEKRKFPYHGLRCNYKQIEIKNAYTIIAGSDLYSQGTLSKSLKTLTLSVVTNVWPSDCVGYFISFVGDNYTQEFEIITRNSATVITLRDPLSLLPVSGTYKWEMRGFRKDEKLHLLSYVIHYKLLSDSQKPYFSSTDSGGNA